MISFKKKTLLSVAVAVMLGQESAETCAED